MKSVYCFFYMLSAIMLLFNSCTFEESDNTPLVVERIDSMGDSIMPWGTLIFSFNIPVIDSLLNFTIQPDPGSIYNSRLSKSMDTLYLDITGVLAGNTNYLISNDKDIEADNGSVLLKGEVKFNISTLALEEEPNDKIETADKLNDVIYGVASTNIDVDYFAINDTNITEVVLVNSNKKCGFHVLNSNGFELNINENLSDTLIEKISTSGLWPQYVKVFSLVDSDSRYQLEVR